MQIRNRYNETIFEDDGGTLKETVEAAVQNGVVGSDRPGVGVAQSGGRHPAAGFHHIS